MVTHDLKHGHPPTKINEILKNYNQPNKEFDTSAAQLVVIVLVIVFPNKSKVNF